ncbi:MAG: DUF4810 domain-containing protein, partial [Rhodobacteraceae bacterium]|nr:DUF4810 domain-containing protein [Paracoccaceae bacterium]
ARSPISGSALFKSLHDFEAAALRQDWQTAYDLAQSVESSITDNAYIQFRLSQIENALGQPSLARAERAADLQSHDFMLFAHLAGLYMQVGDGDKARQAIDRLAALFPQSPDLGPLRARVRSFA